MEIQYQKDYKKSCVLLTPDPKLDLDSYPVRMLQYHTSDVLLPCSLQSMDNRTEFCYDITAKESLQDHLLHQKVKACDLRELLEEFIRMLSETEMFLLDADQILLQPELVFYDKENHHLQFCWFPGEKTEIYLQFRNLMEYLLPLLDHRDDEAVRIGYGVYRCLMEPGFHIEQIKAQLYRGQRETEVEQEDIPTEREEREEREESRESSEHSRERAQAIRSFFEESDEDLEEAEKKQPGKSGKRSGLLVILWAAAFLGVCVLRCLGYLTFLTFPVLLCGFLIVLALLLVNEFLISKKKKDAPVDGQTQKKGLHQGSMAQASIQWPGKKVVEPEEIRQMYSQGQEQAEAADAGGQEAIRESAFSGQGHLDDTQPLPTQVRSVIRLRSQSPDKRPDLELQRDWAMIGKNADMADVVIDWPTISRIHAKLCKVEQDFYLTDLNSMNGTWVNGTAIAGQGGCKVEAGDVIRFADAEYVLEV